MEASKDETELYFDFTPLKRADPESVPRGRIGMHSFYFTNLIIADYAILHTEVAKKARMSKAPAKTTTARKGKKKGSKPAKDTESLSEEVEPETPNASETPTNPAVEPAVIPGSTASQLKRSFAFVNQDADSTGVDKPSSSGSRMYKPAAEHDPENHIIKKLRDDEGLKWGEIAELLNEKRIKAGRVPNFTDNAIYSRYFRNAPRIAALNGEAWEPRVVGKPTTKQLPRPQPLRFTTEQDSTLR